MKLMFVFLILFNASCAWSDIPDYQKAKQRYQEKMFEAAKLNYQLLGKDREKVNKVLGKPVEVSKKLYPYLADQGCTGPDCEKKLADEVWFYEFTYKDTSGKHVYSINVYFKDGKVVQVY